MNQLSSMQLWHKNLAFFDLDSMYTKNDVWKQIKALSLIKKYHTVHIYNPITLGTSGKEIGNSIQVQPIKQFSEISSQNKKGLGM